MQLLQFQNKISLIITYVVTLFLKYIMISNRKRLKIDFKPFHAINQFSEIAHVLFFALNILDYNN